MTDFDRKLFVTEAIYTAALMMLYDKKLNDDYVRLCIEQTLKYDLGIIEKALKNWVIYNRGRGNMPQASQLAEECKRLAGKNTANNDLPARCDDLYDLPARCDMTNLALIPSGAPRDINMDIEGEYTRIGTIWLPCLKCGKKWLFDSRSLEARGLFNVFCLDGDCEDDMR
jgi:hypothetical protein